MQMKNKILLFFIFLFILGFKVNADEFNITAKEILVDKENEILIGTGSVSAVDKDGNKITGDKITYNKSKEFLLAEGNVKIVDVEGNILLTDSSTYDKINEIIVTNENSQLRHLSIRHQVEFFPDCVLLSGNIFFLHALRSQPDQTSQ